MKIFEFYTDVSPVKSKEDVDVAAGDTTPLMLVVVVLLVVLDVVNVELEEPGGSFGLPLNSLKMLIL